MPLFKINSGKHVQSYSLSDPDIIEYLTGGSNPSHVSADDALKNSDIFALISQLANDLALVTYQAPTSRMQSLIDSPATDTNGYSFWTSMFAQLLLDGNAYAYRWKNANGVDLRWEFLRPSQVEPQLLADGSGLIYNLTFEEPSIGFMENVPAPDMIHIRLMGKNGGKTGFSPLDSLMQELKIKEANNKLALHSLTQSVEAPGILTIQGGGLLNWKKKSARSREFMNQVNSSNNGPIVLDDLESYQPLEVKSDTAKLLAQTDWTGRQIAKAYGIPDSYLNGQGDQQSNLDQISNQYARAINRYAASIASELENKLRTKIEVNIRPAIDSTGDVFANTISNLTRYGALVGNQARFVLQRANYLPTNLPVAEKTTVIQNKGGENDNEEN